jgi:hypothetical protein
VPRSSTVEQRQTIPMEASSIPTEASAAAKARSVVVVESCSGPAASHLESRYPSAAWS